jgi:hypothetical protein
MLTNTLEEKVMNTTSRKTIVKETNRSSLMGATKGDLAQDLQS